ncbi:MAG: hypothetical protein M1831_007399 [Alyxoria varia]|nr:MAG: hypothetical protein M1831_007399 [Alyxoria varia]
MSGQPSEDKSNAQSTPQQYDDDEPDDWDKRIFSTGCSVENTKLNDCFFDTKDWRKCRKEMETFKECWKRQGNEQRTSAKDA